MELIDVTVRDGLQALPIVVPTELKIEIIQRLVGAGVSRLEVASFVNPSRVPQMADAEDLLAGLTAVQATLVGLVLNERGARRALATNVHQVNTVCVATQGLAKANQGRSSDETVSDAAGILELLIAEGRDAHATIGAAFGAPDDKIEHKTVLDIVKRLTDAGAREIVLADTLGVATPHGVASLIATLQSALPSVPIRLHLHDPNGIAIENARAGLEHGILKFDCSVAGLGGCPSTDQRSSNLSLEDGAVLAREVNSEFCISPSAIRDVSNWVREQLASLAGVDDGANKPRWN